MTIPQGYPYANIKSAKAKIWQNKQPILIEISSRTVARTIVALALKGEQGITALEMSSWAFRLGAYIHILKHKYGLDIQTQREEHPYGWHGRYVLHTPVEIQDVQFEK